MSQFSADTLMPLISALPENEQHLLRDKLNKMLQKKDSPKKARKRPIEKVAAQLGAEWLPENEEMMISKIMHGDF